jgi:hypothetical protein
VHQHVAVDHVALRVTLAAQLAPGTVQV